MCFISPTIEHYFSETIFTITNAPNTKFNTLGSRPSLNLFNTQDAGGWEGDLVQIWHSRCNLAESTYIYFNLGSAYCLSYFFIRPVSNNYCFFQTLTLFEYSKTVSLYYVFSSFVYFLFV